MNINTTTRGKASGRPHGRMRAAFAAAVSLSLLLGGTAYAAPEQGGTSPSAPEQGGTTDAGPEQGGTSPSPEQGGTTPAPAPAPAPEAPSYTPGPLGVPAAPSAPESEHVTPPTPQFDNAYTPGPPAGGFRPTPNEPPVKRIAPKPKTFRAGNLVIAEKDIPSFPNKHAWIDWGNGWTAWGEQTIANELIKRGVPRDEASRQAAATVVGAVAGGAIGGAISFTATTIVVGTFSVPIGAAIGAGVGSTMANPISILGGAALGAGIGAGGALAAGTAAGIAGAALGAAVGGAAGYLLGAGDPGATVKNPPKQLPNGGDRGGKHREPEPQIQIVDPGAGQFEVHVPATVAKQAGLPPVDYVVGNGGDVNLQVGATKVGWTAKQAQAPIKAVEKVLPGTEKAINNGVRAAGRELAKVAPDVTVAWPQEGPSKTPTKSGGPKHAR